MKILVTGGAGFIGSHIAHRFCHEERDEVVVLDNLSVGSRENVPTGCRFIEGDINDPVVLSEALLDVDVVLHNAAFVSIRGSFTQLEKDLRDNCRGTLALFREAGKCGVQRIVFASSMAVYGDTAALPVGAHSPALPISPYGYSKLRGEMYGRILADEYGFSFTALRYFNTYGVRQTPSDYVGVLTSFINMILEGRAMTVYGDGEQTRDLVWVEDVAEANVLAARSNVEGIFNVGSGHEVSINELARMVQECIGGSVVQTTAPPGEVRRICADISRTQAELGYRPKGTIREQIPRIVDYWHRKKGRSRLALVTATASNGLRELISDDFRSQ